MNINQLIKHPVKEERPGNSQLLLYLTDSFEITRMLGGS